MFQSHGIIGSVVTAMTLLTSAARVAACTVFFTYDGTLALAGDNEDWGDPNTQVWVVPAESGKHAVVYFGFGKGTYPPHDVAQEDLQISKDGIATIKPEDLYGHPQQGMNDRGLFFGGAATEVIQPIDGLGRVKRSGQQLVHEVMRSCASVQQALELLRRYDINQVQGQWMFGDKFGDAFIIEAGNVIIQRKHNSLVMTNFLASRIEPEKIKCSRYRHVQAHLAQESRSSHELVRSLLKESAGEWTQYSTIFDCTHGTITVFRRGDFETSVKLSVTRDTKHGKLCVSIADLFSHQGITIRSTGAADPVESK